MSRTATLEVLLGALAGLLALLPIESLVPAHTLQSLPTLLLALLGGVLEGSAGLMPTWLKRLTGVGYVCFVARCLVADILFSMCKVFHVV